jgi:hypothetical protein
MNRSAILVVVGLLAVAPGCAVSASSSSHTGSSSGSSNSGVPGGAGSTGKPALQTGDPAGAGSGGASTPTPAAPCVAAVNDAATSLFTGRVLIRLPKGLELVEQNPFFANLTNSAAAPPSTSCGTPVRYGAVGFFQQPAGASITQVRDTLLELRGIPPDTVTWAEEGTRGRNYTGAYTATADAKTGAPPVRGWLVLREAPGDKHAYFAMFETDEASWDAVRPVFQEAGKTLLVKPRALQGPESIQPAPAPEPTKPKPKAKSKAAGTVTSK